MLRDARVPKVHDWLLSYVVEKSPHVEELRLTWFADPDPVVAGAGWALTSDRVAESADGLDLPHRLDGFGHPAVQLARSAGAHIIAAVAGPAELARVRDLAADAVDDSRWC